MKSKTFLVSKRKWNESGDGAKCRHRWLTLTKGEQRRRQTAPLITIALNGGHPPPPPQRAPYTRLISANRKRTPPSESAHPDVTRQLHLMSPAKKTFSSFYRAFITSAALAFCVAHPHNAPTITRVWVRWWITMPSDNSSPNHKKQQQQQQQQVSLWYEKWED